MIRVQSVVVAAAVGTVLGCGSTGATHVEAGPASAPLGRVHTIVPSPKTVVWGGYDPMAEPALRVASGDVVQVDAVSTCNPAGLLRNGIDSAHIEPHRLELQAARSSMKTGPGGHILTGPIYVESADSGDVLEVRFLSIRPIIDYACNSFGPTSGFLPEAFPNTSRTKLIALDTVRNVGRFSPTIEIPLHPF